MVVSAWCGGGPLVSAALLLALVAATAASSLDQYKRAEMSPAPFMMASRYGRSGPRLMPPRNDKFFMNSRYGKRSEPPLPTSPLPSPRGPARGRGGGVRGARALLCEYTGVYPLYRCVARVRYNRRHYDDPGAGAV